MNCISIMKVVITISADAVTTIAMLITGMATIITT